jgi:LysR family hca operon transcriptional activator
MGFLTGHELKWMPEALRILRDELPNIDVMVSSQYSPLLADGLSKGKIDAAFLRREKGLPELAYPVLVKEPLMVVCPVTTVSLRSKPLVRRIWWARHS